MVEIVARYSVGIAHDGMLEFCWYVARTSLKGKQGSLNQAAFFHAYDGVIYRKIIATHRVYKDPSRRNSAPREKKSHRDLPPAIFAMLEEQ